MEDIMSDKVIDKGVSMLDAHKRGLARIHPDASIAIPVIQTVSLRKILEFFGEKIVALKAEGGTTGGKTEVLNELYGVDFVNITGEIINIKYKQERTLSGGFKNPLDAHGQKIMLDNIEEKLESIQLLDEVIQLPDIAVSKFTIEVIDDDFAKIAAEVTPWFDGDRNRFLITGVNDPAEDRPGSQAKRPIDDVLRRNRGLMQGQGFKARVMNFRRVIETARVYGPEKELYIAHWDGPEDHFPKFPTKLGEYMYDNILPDTYAELNYYYPDAQSIIQLDGWVSR